MEYLMLALLFAGVLIETGAQQCGRRSFTSGNQFVVGGSFSRPGAWPWQATFMKYRRGCGGSLINTRWVVTAAHCVDNYQGVAAANSNNLKIRLGEYDKDRTEGTEQDYDVERVIIHARWSRKTNDYDIALIKLATSVKYTKYIQPICLASRQVPHGSSCYATGWGEVGWDKGGSRVMKQGALRTFACPSYVRSTSRIICAKNPGISACRGDSGGPFACQVGGRWQLQGVSSFVMNKCRDLTAFANVVTLRGWINDQMTRNGGETGPVVGNTCKDTRNWNCRRLAHLCSSTPKVKKNCCATCSRRTSGGNGGGNTCKDVRGDCGRYVSYCNFNTRINNRRIKSVCCATCARVNRG